MTANEDTFAKGTSTYLFSDNPSATIPAPTFFFVEFNTFGAETYLVKNLGNSTISVLGGFRWGTNGFRYLPSPRAAVPEPGGSSLLLLGSLIVAAGMLKRRTSAEAN